MEKIQDKIYDVYYSENESNFQRKVRERIHWVCQNVSGNKILDIGCSQGITAILLGREGKKVLGLDISNAAIKDAKQNLEIEEEPTKNSVVFEKDNFMIRKFEQQYDSVILGEVLEHINDINAFFSKAASIVKEEGRIIVTTPFGINDFVDHKRTFYLYDFLKLENSEISIEEVKFFGKWIGVIYKKNQISNNTSTKEVTLLENLEDAFYTVERELLSTQRRLNKKVKLLDDKSKVLENQIKELKAQNNELQEQNQLLAKNEASIEEENNYKQKYLDEKVEKVKIQKQLLDEYSKEEKLLKQNNELVLQIKKLENRYFSLKNSKLGKLTTKYWKFRNKRRN